MKKNILSNNYILGNLSPKQFRIAPHAKIIFLCGKNSEDTSGARYIFHEYAKKHFNEYIFLIAEDVFSILNDDSQDLLTLESYMASCSDCIIIILESESAFAELGAFSHSDDIAKKILVINDRQFMNLKSFINLGPIKKINKKSNFGQTIYTDFQVISRAANEIQSRISKIRNTKSRLVTFAHSIAMESNHKDRLFFLAELIRIFSPITKKEIIFYLDQYFNNATFNTLSGDLAMLEAFNFIKKSEIDGKIFYIGTARNYDFVKLHANVRAEMRSLVVTHYMKKEPKRMVLLSKEYNYAI